MDWNLVRQHVANTTVEERNAKRQEVSSDDVEAFVENYGKVFSGVANSAGSNSYVSSAERAANANALEALERRRKRAQEYLEKKSGDYKNGDELLSDITNSANDIEVLKRTNTAVNDYWNQWSSESDYNDYLDYVKEQERLAHLNIKEARDKKYALEQERDNLGQDIKQEVGKIGTVGIVASGRKGQNQNAYYGLASKETEQRRLELEREIQALDRDINLASRIQQANFEKNFALEAPDFEEYSLAGKNIRDDLAEQASNVYTHEAFSKNYRNPNAIDQTVRFMNDEQRQIYDYYLGKYGKERADEYLYTIADDVNMRRAEAIYEGSEDNIAYQTLLTLASGVEQWSEGHKSNVQMLMGSDEYRPQGSLQYAAGMAREDLADVGVLPEWATNIVGDRSLGQMAFDFTQTAGNMLPSIVLGSLGGGIVGNVSLGLSASGNAYQEMIREGYNKEQARSYAALVGASETLLEHVLGGIGALGGKLSKAATTKLLTKVDNALARAAIKFGTKQMAEFTEEYLQEILDPFFRNLALMEENEIKLITPDAIYSGILGALSAGVFEGRSVISEEVQYQKADKFLAEKYSSIAGEAIENGLQRAEGSDMRKLAEAAQKKQEKGKDLSGRQMQELVLGEDKARIAEAAENRLKTLGETKDTAVVAKAIQKTVTGENLSAKERVALNHSTYGKRVLNELDPFNIVSESTSSAWTKDIGTREIGKDFYSRPKVEAKATEAEAQKTEEAKPVDVVEEAFKKSGIRIGSVGISSKDTVREVLSNVEGITPEAAEKLANVYEEEGGGVSANEFIRKTAKAFNIGYLNTPVESVKSVFSNSSVSPSAMMRAYYIGSETFAKKHKGEALASQATTIKGVKGKVVFEKGVDRKKLKPLQRVAIEVMEKVLADATNVEFHIFESYVRDGKRYYIDEFGVEQEGAPNGKFVGNVHQIWIDINAGGKGEGAMLFTLFHELTHNIHVWSPEHFNTLAKITAEAFARGGYSFEDAVNSKMAQYAKYENYTRDDCIEEVIAEAMSGLGYDGKVIEDIANQVKAQDKTLWQKIVDWLGSIVDRIKKAYAQLSPSAPEAKILMQQKELFEQAQKVFAEAVVTAGRNYKNASAQSTIGQVKNADTNAKFQARNSDGSQQNQEKKRPKISIGMTDSERTKILRYKKIVAPVYEGQADDAINANISDLESRQLSTIKSVITKIGEEFGVYIDYNIKDIDMKISLSKNNLKESMQKDATPTQIAKLLPILKSVVENSVGIEQHANRYYHDSATLYFEELLGGYIDGENFIPVRFGIRHSKSSKPVLYVVVDQNGIETKKIKAEVKNKVSPSQEGAALPRSAFKYSLSQIIHSVNSKDLLRYLPDNMLNSEQKNLKWKGIAETIEKTKNKNDENYFKFVQEGNNGALKDMVRAAAKAHGYGVVAFHGTSRADRVGNVFLPERATSGPMAFFTDDKATAEGYATGKRDTSIAYDPDFDSYETQFRVKVSGMDIPFYRAWGYLPFDARNRVAKKASQLREDWDGDNELILDPETNEANGGFQWQLKEARGNVIKALIDQWLNSGNLFNEEAKFLDVIEMSGLKEEFAKVGINTIYFKDPNARHEKVYEVYLKINNPFDTATVDEQFISGFIDWYEKQDESKYQRENMESDLWDKNGVDAYEFAERLKRDIENDTTHAWTSIPDSVTDYLKHLGYDGIKDLGGKFHETTHTVWIPFYSNQVKSAEPITYDENDNAIPISKRFDEEKVDIRYSERDSDGGELSKEQVEFFKDSKVRDEQGNLLVLYHGGYNNTVFTGRGEGFTYNRNAIYMTEREDIASAFSYGARNAKGNVYKLYANIKNPFVIDAEGRSYVDIPIPDDAPESLKDKFWYDNTADLDNLPVWAEQEGYDGIIVYNVREGVGGGPATEVIAFRSNQVKFVDNKTPTADPDIRYSDRESNGSREESAEVVRLREQYLAKREELNQNEIKQRDLEKSEEQKKLIADIVDSGMSQEAFDAYNAWVERTGYSEIIEKVKQLKKEEQELRERYDKAVADEEKRKEVAAIESSGLNEADYHRKQALKEFGYTPSFVDAAYILPNGKMLNFSGEKGKHFGFRGEDHRAIGRIYNNLSGSKAMVKFMQEGNIRIMPEGPSVDISSVEKPTKEQYAVIKKFVQNYSKEEYFSIDFTDAEGHTVGAYSYEGKVNADRVVNDIKYFFENGETRPESGIGRFLYQEREEDLSERGILAKALESAAQGDIEAKNLKNYKKHLAEYDELNIQLHLMKVELDEARKAKDTAKVRELKDKITQTENRLAVFDKRLLKLEAAAPLKALVERERKNAVARADERLSKALANQKKKDAEKLDKALERAKESRQKTIDRLRESSKVKGQEMRRVLRESQEFARADGFLAGQMSQGREDAAKMRKMGEQYEAQIQKGKERLSEQKLMAEQKLLAQAERYRTSIKNATEGRHRTEVRNKIKRKIGQLNALLNGGKEKHVPEAMRGAVASALDIINMDDQRYYTSRLTNLRDKLARATSSSERNSIAFEIQKIELQQTRFKDSIDRLKASWEEIRLEEDGLFDPLIAEKIDRVSLDIGETLLRDMSMTQLEEVYDLYSMVLKRVQEANKLHDEQRKGEISELGKQAITEFSSMKQRNKIVSANKLDLEKFSWNNEKPIYAFMRIGSKVLQERFEAIRNGEDTWARDISEAMDFFEKAKKQYNFKKWNRTKTFEFKSSAGDKFSLDVEQMMSIYAYSKRKDADKHLMEGGFVFDPRTEIKKSKQGNKKLIQKHLEDATTYNISAETIQEIASKLTEEQRGYADTMQNYLSEVMGAKGNEVSMAMYDVKLFKEKNYFPLKSSKLYRFETDNPAGEIKLKNSGFSKDRIPGANNPIVLTGFTDVWAGHVNDMSMYHAFVLPIDDFTRVYNYRTPIFPHQKSVKAELENVHGAAASAYIQKLLEDINGGARVDSTVGVWNRFVGRFKKASVMASLSVVIQQPSSIMRAFAEINPKYLIGLPKVPVIQHAKTWNEIKKYAPVAVIKEMGYFDTNMGLSTVDYIKGEKNIMEKVDDFFGRLPGYADEATWGAIWHMVKRETKAKHPSLKVSSDEFLELCGKRFTDIVVKTQVYDSVLSRSANMRSTDGLMKMATAFMAEPTTSINMLAQAVRDGKKHPGKSIAVATSVVSSVILNSALSSFVYAMRDEEEDETFWEKYVKHFSKEILDGFNPLTYLPLYKDIWSIIQGWDIKRSDMDLIDKLYTKCMTLSSLVFTDTEDMSEEEKKEYNKQLGWAIAETIGALGDLVGIPAKNLVREFKGAINTYNMWTRQHNEETKLVGTKLSMRHAFANGLIDILPEILLEPLDKFGIVKDRNVQDKIYEAVKAGDKEYLDRLRKGFDSDKAFDKQIRWALRNNDERLVEAVIARHEGRFKDYESLVKEMVADGFSKQNVITAVEAETFEMFPEESEETVEKIKGLYNADDFLVAYNKNNSSFMEVIRDDIIKTHVANGKTEDEAEAKFNSTIYSAVRERYENGEITADAARKILENHSGRTEQNAKAAVTLWDYQAQYPDDDVEIYWINDYYEDIEASGVGLKTYVDYRNDAKLCKGKDANGDGKTDSGSVKKEKLLVIDALPISKEQKDAIYFSEGWPKSTLWEAPWR